MAVRIREIKCYVWSTLLYGCEPWTLSSVMMKKLEAFETWLYRKMLRISWKDRNTNEEVYCRMGTSKAFLGDIVSVSIFRRTLLWYYAEEMHANC